MTSIGLRPAGLFLSLTGVNTAASISSRKLSNGTTRAIISSGSPFAVIAASRLSASKNPNCPIVPTRESCCHNSDSHKSAEVAIFRRPLQEFRQAGFVEIRRAPLRFLALVFVIEPGSDRVVCVMDLDHEIGDREL